MPKPPQKRDPSIIDRAPISKAPTPVSAAEALLGELASQLEEVEAENERLKGEVSVEQVRAKMMRPYANRVFWFVVFYCVAVGLVLITTGFKVRGFDLPPTVLAIIAGSTATSVLGLIGIIVSGLFGAGRR